MSQCVRKMAVIKWTLIALLQLCVETFAQTIDEMIEAASKKPVRRLLPVSDTDGKLYILTELDLLLSPKEYLKYKGIDRSGFTESNKRFLVYTFQKWRNKTIPFFFSEYFTNPEKQMILKGFKHWTDYTCLKVRPKEELDSNYLFISGGDGCQSHVGAGFDGVRRLILGPGCRYDEVIIHEIGHTIGYYHEHTRGDRDDYITIIEQNIRPGFRSQFSKGYNFYPMGIPYDLASIMHYSSNIFSKDRRKFLTIKTKDPSKQHLIDERQTEISFYDIKGVNWLYECDSHCSGKPKCPPVAFLSQDCVCKCYGSPVRNCTKLEIKFNKSNTTFDKMDCTLKSKHLEFCQTTRGRELCGFSCEHKHGNLLAHASNEIRTNVGKISIPINPHGPSVHLERIENAAPTQNIPYLFLRLVVSAIILKCLFML